MARYDCVLIDPDGATLEQALQRAVASANHRCRKHLLSWPLEQGEPIDLEGGPATGYRQWNGGKETARAGEGRSIVVLAWWTDRAGRKHYRIVGRHGAFHRPMLENLLCPFGEPRPPLWFVYPDHVFLKRWGNVRIPQAICACGAYGSPDELGWMGPCCDACYDRGEEGQRATLAWLEPRQATLHAEEGRMLPLSYSPEGNTLAVGSGRNHVTLWDIATGTQRGRLETRSDDWLLGVNWLEEGGRLVTLQASGRLRFWNGRTGLPLEDEVSLGPSECFALSPDGTLLGQGHRSGVRLYSLSAGWNLERELMLREVSVLTFSPDGQLIAAGTRQGVLAVWEVSSGRLHGWYEEAGARVTSLAFSPHGPMLAVAVHPAAGRLAREAESLLLWEVGQAEMRARLPGHPGGSRAVAWTPDGRVLASGGEDGLLRLWEVHSGEERVALEWHRDGVTSLAFAPDGMTLASGSFEGTIKLWPREVLRPLDRMRVARVVAGGC